MMNGSGRIIAIADIHGCSREFKALLQQISPDPANDTLIILGDVIDRGYDSEGVIRELIELKDVFRQKMIWLAGNHEDDLVQRNAQKHFFIHPPRDALSTYIRLFSELPLIYETEECVFVHAGFNGDPDDRQIILRDRSVLNGERIYQGKLYISGHSPFHKHSFTPLAQPLYIDETGQCHIVYDGMKLPEKGAIFIDTGCVYKNRLTAFIIAQDHTIQISFVKFIGI